MTHRVAYSCRGGPPAPLDCAALLADDTEPLFCEERWWAILKGRVVDVDPGPVTSTQRRGRQVTPPWRSSSRHSTCGSLYRKRGRSHEAFFCPTPLCPGCRWDDCVRQRFIATASGLAQIDPRVLPSLFCDRTGKLLREVNPDQLQAALVALSTSSTLTRASFADYSALQIFKLYSFLVRVSPPSADAVESRDLVAALCFLSGGGKSAKLALLFDLYSDDGSGLLSRVGLWRLLRALLLALCGLSAAASADVAAGLPVAAGSADALRRSVADAAAACVQAAFASADGGDGRIGSAEHQTHLDFEASGAVGGGLTNPPRTLAL